jgi:hypothetical protein
MAMRNFGGQQHLTWKSAAVRAAPADHASHMEHRWGVRRPCRARVCVSAGAAIAGVGRLVNVSMSGALLETALPLPLFSQIAVAVLRADGCKHAVELMATVVRIANDGVGIEWCESAEGSICQLMGCAIDCRSGIGH